MAHFIGSVAGNRGPASRLGTAMSGISTHAQGWELGVHVAGNVKEDDEDEFRIWLTPGSNNAGKSQLLATVTRSPTGYRVVWPAHGGS